MKVNESLSQKIPFGFYYWSTHKSLDLAELSLWDDFQSGQLSQSEALQAKVIPHDGVFVVVLPDYNALTMVGV